MIKLNSVFKLSYTNMCRLWWIIILRIRSASQFDEMHSAYPSLSFLTSPLFICDFLIQSALDLGEALFRDAVPVWQQCSQERPGTHHREHSGLHRRRHLLHVRHPARVRGHRQVDGGLPDNGSLRHRRLPPGRRWRIPESRGRHLMTPRMQQESPSRSWMYILQIVYRLY